MLLFSSYISKKKHCNHTISVGSATLRGRDILQMVDEDDEGYVNGKGGASGQTGGSKAKKVLGMAGERRSVRSSVNGAMRERTLPLQREGCAFMQVSL